MRKKVIYDLGANDSGDIPYYLLKSDIVVAVEANPILCAQINKKFKTEVQAGRLIVENCVLTDETVSDVVEFYIHTSNHVLSQLQQPAPGSRMMFEKVELPAKTICELIKSHGQPFYIKIDIEHYDVHILKSLFSNGIFPPFISAESHAIEVFCLLVALGGYNAFKIVDGGSVSKVYSNRPLVCEREQKQEVFSFPFHAAGPFGNDVDGPWMTADNFLKIIALEKLGWKDIHATNVVSADPSSRLRDYDFILRYSHRMIKDRLAWIWAGVRRRLTFSLMQVCLCCEGLFSWSVFRGC